MNSRERMIRAIRYQSPDNVPVAPYLAGEYSRKLVMGTDFDSAYAYIRHRCDWIQLFFKGKLSPEEIIEKHKGEYFLARGFSSPYARCKEKVSIGDFLLALKDNPGKVKELCERNLGICLKETEDTSKMGMDGIWLEETLCSSDVISPEDYLKFAFPYEKKLITAIKDMGLIAILYFCGNVIPLLPYINELEPDALAVEENKKNIKLDIVEIRNLLGKGICLFGNLDTVGLLLKGDKKLIEAELRRQIKLADSKGGFIAGTGSPVPYATSPETIDYFVETVRRLERERV
ncbi:MAG: hypothetical protein IMF10_06315 [Proteobacteria bacterium]|nr:hypothetical protein [Pseudomonadota bacterium]